MPAIDYSQLDRIVEQEKKEIAERTNYVKIKYLKLPQGTHLIRLLPKGNESDETFYRYSKMHKYGSGKGLRKVVCWDYLMQDHETRLASYKQAEAIRRNPEASLLSYLEKNDRIVKAEYIIARKLLDRDGFGCPICRAQQALYNANVPDDLIKRIEASHDYLFNVWYFKRSTPKEDEPGPALIEPGHYLWTQTSARGKNDVMAAIKEARNGTEDTESNDDPLDLFTGMNLSVRAEGEGQTNRRYSYSMKPSKGRWMRYWENGEEKIGNPKDLKVYDLIADVEAPRFVSYNGLIKVAMNHWGNTLANLNFEFEGIDKNYDPASDGLTRTKADKEAAKAALANVAVSFDDDDDDLEKRKAELKKQKERNAKKAATDEDDELVVIDDDDIPF